MTKIYKKIMNVILIILIVLLSIYALLRFTNRVEIYKVRTGSMEDGIHVGDYILITKRSNYKIGDVVTYKIDNYYITHRIVEINDDKVITKGDANNTEDKAISKSDIIGKVMFKGGLLNFIIKYKYILVCILLGLYLLSYYFDKNETNEENTESIKEIKKEAKKNKQK